MKKKSRIINIEYGKWYFYVWFGKQVKHLKFMPKRRQK